MQPSAPTDLVPEMAGRLELTGEPIFASTAVVRFEKAEFFPTEFVAVTVARSIEPIWLVPMTKLEPVTPAMSVHAELTAEQLCHW